MQQFNIIVRRALLTLTFPCLAHTSHAQVLKVIKTASDALKTGTETVTQISNTVKSVRERKNQFDSTVKIIKDNVHEVRGLAREMNPPKFRHGKFYNFKWEPVAQFEGQIFTSVLVSMKGYDGKSDDEMLRGVNSGALGFWFRGDKPGIPLRWEIESVDKSYFDKVVGTFTMEKDRQQYYVMPAIPWNTQALTSLPDSTPIRIVYRLYDAAGNKEERSEKFVLRSTDRCIVSYEHKPLDFLYTAFVQEKHPEAVKIIKDAAKIKFKSSVKGYPPADLATLMRVCALWKVLHDRGVSYSGRAATCVDEEHEIVTQRVHTFAEAIQLKNGNSVDGMIVFASLLRAMGIASTLEVTGGNSFIGFYTSGTQGKNLVYLDLSMLSDSDKISKASVAEKNNAYVAQFLKAVDEAKKKHAQCAVDNDLREIDVNRCRTFVQSMPL